MMRMEENAIVIWLEMPVSVISGHLLERNKYNYLEIANINPKSTQA